MDPTTAIILGSSAAIAGKVIEAVASPVLGAVGEGLWPQAVAWRNQRVKRAEETLADASRIVRESGVPAQAVPGRILWPILEKSSMEEDEELRRMWANLLASAAGTPSSSRVLPAFIEILGQLSPEEARDLQWFAAQDEGHSTEELLKAYPSIPAREGFGLRIGNLERLGLIETQLRLTDRAFADMLDGIGKYSLGGESIVLESTTDDKMSITGIGLALVRACEGPESEKA